MLDYLTTQANGDTEMSDEELAAVAAAAKAIPSERRAKFLETIGHRLDNSGDFGDGVIARAIVNAERDVVGPRLGITFLVR
jgi:hypothetical protein